MIRSMLAAGILLIALPAFAQEDLRAPILQGLDTVQVKQITLRPSLLRAGLPGAVAIKDVTRLRGGCPPVMSTHTDSDWGPGEYILQAGFAQGETAAASYQMTADQFPMKLDSVEMMFATSNAVVQTTTEWSVLIYSGTPASGTLVAEWSSDDVLLPHLVMPPGSTGMILLFTVDPDDPDQIYIDDNGSHTYSVGFRVDAHNQPGTPCISAPDPNYNAFPCTDISGLDSPSGNWINMVTGLFCVCGEGWSTFQSLPSICRPSGDWVLRSSATPQDCVPAAGACCRSGGTCTDDMTQEDCTMIGGEYQGDDTTCDTVSCPQPVGACCIEATGECVDLEQDLCLIGGGVHHAGESCDTYICFPEGACCLPDGNCVDGVSPEICDAGDGDFQGDGTTCGSTECPQPLGACCLDNSNCIDVEESICQAFAGSWMGPESNCLDLGVCDEDPCAPDVNGDGNVDVNDLLAVIADWGSSGSEGTDINGDGVVDVNDLLLIISSWGACP